MFKIIIEGKPIVQPRPRRAKKGFFYDPSSKVKAQLRPGILSQLESQGFKDKYKYYVVNITFWMPFPSVWGKKKRAIAEGTYAAETTKDLDNCAKFYNDLLPFNDALIVHQELEKKYSFEPRTEITIDGFKPSSP